MPEVSELICDPLEVASRDAPMDVKIEEETGGREECDPFVEEDNKVEDVGEVSTSNHLSMAGTERAAGSGQATKGRKQQRGLKKRPQANEMGITGLMKELNKVKKTNRKLYSQLQRFNANESVLQLENRLKEKQKQIDELARENRTLTNSERNLMKEIEDIQNSKDNFPSKERALQEELRVSKKRIKQLKEMHRTADEKGFKLHQQSFDLAVRNKELSEKVRKLEGVFASSSMLSPPSSSIYMGAGTSNEEVQTIIASQEQEITKLQHRVVLMKKTHKAEQSKYERLLKLSQEEIEQTNVEMEEFYQQLLAKERAARAQFLHMKKLKHALHELALTEQMNQRFQPFLANWEMRLTNRSNSTRPNHESPHSPQKGPEVNSARWIHEALHHLGFVMPQSSNEVESIKPPTNNKEEDQTNIPSNCIQGKLVPLPPSKTGFTVSSSSTRALLFNRSSSGPSGEVNTDTKDNQYDVNGMVHSSKDTDEDGSVTVGEPASHIPENPDEELD